MNPLTWQNPEQLFVAQVLKKIFYNSVAELRYIRKLVAIHFRFSTIDPNFNIFINGAVITLNELDELSDNTQFVWGINNCVDPFVLNKIANGKNKKRDGKISSALPITGYIASVDKPSKLKIRGLDEKITIDLFVNGRLREKDVLKHITTTRIVESYLYGQIHYDALDGDGDDRFTSSREGIKADDPKFKEFVIEFESIIRVIIKQWDEWRIELNQEGDSENMTVTRKERKSKELFGAITEDFIPPHSSPTRHKIQDWLDQLGADAQFNFSTYGECFVAENLLRKYISGKSLTYSESLNEEITKCKKQEGKNKQDANLSIDIRRNSDDLSYGSMSSLAYTADTNNTSQSMAFRQDAKRFKPVRDAMAHTALLTDEAKNELTSVYNNIKARIKNLL